MKAWPLELIQRFLSLLLSFRSWQLLNQMWRVWLSTFENHWFGMVQLLPPDWWAHILVPKMGGPNCIPCSIPFSVAEPVFHSSVEKHVYSTPPPGSAASSPSPRQSRGCGLALAEAPRMAVAAGTAQGTGSAQGIPQPRSRPTAAGKRGTSRVQLNRVQKLGKYF